MMTIYYYLFTDGIDILIIYICAGHFNGAGAAAQDCRQPDPGAGAAGQPAAGPLQQEHAQTSRYPSLPYPTFPRISGVDPDPVGSEIFYRIRKFSVRFRSRQTPTFSDKNSMKSALSTHC